MIYATPGQEGSVITFNSRYENFIGGEWVSPAKGVYFDNISPVTGEAFCEIPRSSAEDIDLALKYFKNSLQNKIHREWLVQPYSYNGFLDLGDFIYDPGAYEILMRASKNRPSLHPDIVYIEKQLYNYDYYFNSPDSLIIDSLLTNYYSIVN